MAAVLSPHVCGASCKAEAPCRTVLLMPPRVVRVRVRSLASQNAARRLRRPAAPSSCYRQVRCVCQPDVSAPSPRFVLSELSILPVHSPHLCAGLVFRGAQVLRSAAAVCVSSGCLRACSLALGAGGLLLNCAYVCTPTRYCVLATLFGHLTCSLSLFPTRATYGIK